MYDYEHTQPGTFFRVWVSLWAMFFCTVAVVMLESGDRGIVIGSSVTAVLIAIVVVLFPSLTVRVSPNDIALSFGVGLVRKSFLIDDIKTAAVVRNRWYNGWGIKRIRGGWLYNVAGFDAVEIQLKNDRRYRIGTDQPRELLAAIESATATSS